jgi:hypothetical protein
MAQHIVWVGAKIQRNRRSSSASAACMESKLFNVHGDIWISIYVCVQYRVQNLCQFSLWRSNRQLYIVLRLIIIYILFTWLYFNLAKSFSLSLSLFYKLAHKKNENHFQLSNCFDLYMVNVCKGGWNCLYIRFWYYFTAHELNWLTFATRQIFLWRET